uniref:Uncharacterized protein n=1 Tax=Glossina brevipalpis TaxID=37001 RepID=A0A1A9WSD7_9MUSC
MSKVFPRKVKSSQTKFKNSTDNSVQITDNTGFRTANGKDISISKEGKKRLEGINTESDEPDRRKGNDFANIELGEWLPSQNSANQQTELQLSCPNDESEQSTSKSHNIQHKTQDRKDKPVQSIIFNTLKTPKKTNGALIARKNFLSLNRKCKQRSEPIPSDKQKTRTGT